MQGDNIDRKIVTMLGEKSQALRYFLRCFDTKHLKKAEGCIGRNVVSIMMMKTIVLIQKEIKIIKLHIRNLDK